MAPANDVERRTWDYRQRNKPGDLLSLATEANQVRIGAQVHPSAGDCGGGMAFFAQRVDRKQLVGGGCPDHYHLSIRCDAVQPAGGPHGRAEEFPCGLLSPQRLTCCTAKARDVPNIVKREQQVPHGHGG